MTMNLLRRLIRLTQEGSLYALLLLLPFSIAAVEISFGVLLLTWLMARLDPRTRSDTVWLQPQLRALAWVLGGYVLACALSIGVSRYPALSISGFFNKWLEYLWLFVIVTDVASRPRVVRRSLRMMLYASVFVLIEALSQEHYRRGFFRGYRLDFFDRMTGPYKNPIDLATYLMTVLLPLLAYTLTRLRTQRLPLWGVLILLLMSLIRTEAMGAWLGFALGAGFLTMASARTVRRCGALLLVVLVVAGGVFLKRQQHLQDVVSFSEIGKRDRVAMWQAALHMIKDRPLLGHGLNTFMANYLAYWVGGERQPRYAHNCYLQVAAETGLIGLAFFLWLLALLSRQLWTSRQRLGAREAMLLAGFSAGLLAFAAQAGIDTNFYSLRQAALFWTLAGIALGLTMQSTTPQQHREDTAALRGA